MTKKKILLIVVAVLLGLLALGAGGFFVWANDAARPMPEALAAMQSDTSVEFSTVNGWLVFQPAGAAAATGLVIYPGGKIDYRAYAPVAREIAAQGYLVVVPPVPLNLALFNPNLAGEVMDAFPQVEHWAVGGHSLGGVAASTFAAAHPDRVQGLALWASYPASDMHTYPRQVVSIYGTNDGLAPPAKIEESKTNLPPTTEYVAIEGGNHGQFGAYGSQSGDNAATISRAEQQTQVANATAAMLSRLQ